MTPDRQELAAAARVIRASMRDKSYRSTPIGLIVGRYCRWKRNEWGATPATMRDYEIPLSRLAVDHADLKLADFEPPVGTDLVREFLERHWGERAPRTRAKNLSILRDFFRWAVAEGLIYGEPTVPIRRPRKRGTVRGVFAEHLPMRIVQAQPRLRDRVALLLLFELGLRKAELCGVRFADFDGSRKLLTIRGKGGKVRTVPYHVPHLIAALEQHILEREAAPAEYLLYPERHGPKIAGGPLELLWEDRLKPMGPTTAHRWWHACLARAGVPPQPMHEARHTAISAFIRKTGRMELAQQLAGHTSIQTTVDIYGHVQTSDLEQAMRAMYRDE